MSLVGWFAIFPTFVLHEEGRETYADGRIRWECYADQRSSSRRSSSAFKRSARSSAVFLVRASAIVLPSFLTICFDSRELESLPVLAVRRRPWRISLVCQDKSRFWIRFKVILD